MGAESINYGKIIVIFLVVNLFFTLNAYTVNYYIWFLTAIFFVNIIFKLLLAMLIFFCKNKKNNDFLKISDEKLPVYTILIPAYHEEFNILRNLLNAIYNFSYDREKLDIILLLEKGDKQTIDASEKLKNFFKINTIVVPDNYPKTKPKACNYGLKFAKGEFLVIYDAEDVPEPYQLKKAIWEFRKLPKEYICLQSRLNYYNRNENFLTKCFSIEYTLWFEYYLKIFSDFFNFFPLGGTSNHFKVNKLKEIGGWDSYNVTEDAELGIRIAYNGYKTKILDSFTEEEAVKDMESWIYQRRRWTKGYMQTYFNFMKSPIKLFKKLGFLKFFLFQFLIGGTFLVPLLYIFFIIVSFLYLDLFNITQLSLNLFNNYAYIFLQVFVISILLLKKLNYKNLFLILTYIVYSYLHFFVVFMSIIELIKKPFYWNKTEHNKSNFV